MRIFKLNDMWRGWFIGNFSPAVLKTESFEIGLLKHPKGEIWPDHYHAIATEYNLLVSGHMKIGGREIHPNDIFILEPHEVASPEFLEDCVLVCIKTPSIIGDKYYINESEI